MEAPTKRPRLDADSPTSTAATGTLASTAGHAQAPLERAAGITEYLTPDLAGWSGVLKQRYTDFLVNEIDEDGNVVHLTTLTPPQKQRKPAVETKREAKEELKDQKETRKETNGSGGQKDATTDPTQPSDVFKLSDEDSALLASLISQETADECVSLVKLLSDPTAAKPSITTPTITDKEKRTEIHTTIRRIFSGKLETTTIDLVSDNDAKILIMPARPTNRKRRGGQQQKARQDVWAELGGEYLHFNLYKENRDTMEVVNLIPRILRLPGPAGKAISFAGTKDRRAVTVQRCAAYKVKAERLAGLNKEGDRGLRGAKLGDFCYKPAGLELGQLKGNEFVITLRCCAPLGPDSLEDTVRKAVSKVRATGFANYFGLQRFGSFAAATSTVGIHLLQSDWRGAVECILAYDSALLSAPEDSVSRDERARAEACKAFLETGDAAAAAMAMPKKYVAENALLRALQERGAKSKGAGVDYLGSIQAIPRSLRTMYVHAFQSLVFNHAVSARLRLDRANVIVGDLVLLPKKSQNGADPSGAAVAAEDLELAEVDQHGEAVIAAPTEEAREFDKARALTVEDVASGKFSLADVVLPTPGWDVVYPENEAVGGVYTSLMKEHGLDPREMRRNVKDFSLPGTYRKILSGFVDGECAYEIRKCKKEEQVVQTDLEKIREAQAADKEARAKAKEHAELANGEVKEAQKDGDAMTVDSCVPSSRPSESADTAGTQVPEKRKRDDANGAGATTSPSPADGEKKEEEETVVVLRMRLGTSCYATMALRELMKDGVVAYRPEFGREAGR